MATQERQEIIIGIDSSTSVTGICAITDSKKPSIISYMAIRTKDKDTYEDKCMYILEEIFNFIDKHKPDTISIEIPNSHTNMDTTRKLCGLWGLICVNIFSKYNKKVTSINTTHIKQVVSKNGRAEKEQMVKSVNQIFKTKLQYNKNKGKSDDDIADALGVAYTYIMDKRRNNV